ncbi:CDGSH iron-sulfur domain-containing protein [Vulcanisaeta thermophila]|uniref:CDGSH iron-sulfur domain-containing protein n=1 Tax=Vulcanisaeta thermophila TaxID=867917 RepID=UPI00085296A5|nr:CDGSH iron-sulfur domain-containing protein [Vulcanisaeta thermophila]
MRVVLHTRKGPYEYKTPSGESVWICMCGLSDTYPICSGKHRLVADEKENEVYLYTQDGKRIGVINLDTTQLRKV